MSTIINTTGHTTGITLTDADWNTTHIENGDSRITILAHTDEYPQLVADQIGKALLMDAKTDAGFLPSITLADYLPKGVTIDANPKAKA